MRIIIQMGDSYPTESPCANRIRTFYDEFIKNGDSVKVLAPTIKGQNEEILNKDIVYCRNIPLKSKSTVNRILNQLSLGFSSFFRSLGLGPADVVITTSPPPLISVSGWAIAKIKRAKLVYDVRDIWPDVAWEIGSFQKESAISKLFEMNRNFMLNHAELITTVSEGKKKKLTEYCHSSRIVTIANGLDVNFLRIHENKKVVLDYQLHEGFTCVYVGNMGLAQGLKQLLLIAEKAQNCQLDAQFVLFGSGVEENLLKKYVKDHALHNVLFAGRIPNRDIYTVLNNSDMCFVSLVNRNLTDSIPTKLYEALAVGCPVLLSAIGESAELLKRCKLGIAVEPNDFDGLWTAFLSFYHNPSQFDPYVNESRAVILSDCSRQKMASQMEKELNLLLQTS